MFGTDVVGELRPLLRRLLEVADSLDERVTRLEAGQFRQIQLGGRQGEQLNKIEDELRRLDDHLATLSDLEKRQIAQDERGERRLDQIEQALERLFECVVKIATAKQEEKAAADK
ncbi:hypothetical protein CCP2SC5_160049 [Azospirillaceae bacterium]